MQASTAGGMRCGQSCTPWAWTSAKTNWMTFSSASRYLCQPFSSFSVPDFQVSQCYLSIKLNDRHMPDEVPQASWVRCVACSRLQSLNMVSPV